MTDSTPHWLPERHLGVAATLSHADELIGQVGDLLFAYQTQADGVVGFLTVEPYGPDPRRLEITRFYVHPDWRRAGVGSMLLDAALEQIERRKMELLMRSRQLNRPRNAPEP